MKTLLTALLTIHLVTSVHAEEDKMKFETLLDYKNVTVTKVEPDGIRIVHESGVAKIQIEKLPEEIRTQLGLSDDAAKEHREMLQEKREVALDFAKKQQALASKRLIFTGNVFQVTDGGLLLRNVAYTDGTKEEKKVPYKVKIGGPTGLNPNARTTYETRYNSEWVLKVRAFADWPIFVGCDTSGYVDGSTFSSVVYQHGTFSYTNVQGATKTIPSYTTNPKAVLERAGLTE
ncbi:MAG: hypothetical protein WED15_07265 [Akkermansiaceae bacterium]